jgi:hypothetical protein
MREQVLMICDIPIKTSHIVEKQINIIITLNKVELDRIHPELFPTVRQDSFVKRKEIPISICVSNKISYR